jgi:hypothetical protein
VVLFQALISAAPVPKERAKESYYPTTVGSKWVYLDGDQEYTDVVTAVEVKDGAKVITITRHRAGGQPPFMLAKVAMSEKGVFQTFSGEIELAKPECILPASLDKGVGWQSVLAPKWTRTIVGEEVVEVPAGKFKAIRVDSVSAGRALPQKWSKAWYAPRVGLVKAESLLGSDFVLKSFTPGKE